MQKRSSESRKIALSGVFGSLAAVLMLMGGILPLATYVAFCTPPSACSRSLSFPIRK